MDRKDYKIEQVVTVLDDSDERLKKRLDRYISLSEARDIYGDDIEVGDELRSDFILEEYGRTASANLYQELQYHIQRRVEKFYLKNYKKKIGTILIGTVTRVDR